MINRNNALLVVVDVQGKLADIVQQSAEMQSNVRILVEGMKLLEVPILVTEQYPKGLGSTVPAILEVLGDAPVIEKSTFSCCGAFDFEIKLTEMHKTEIILCGIETHVCVYQTARDLIGLGYNVHLVSDAVSSRTAENRQLGIGAIERMGARITGTEMVLFELLAESGTPEFKAISKLVK